MVTNEGACPPCRSKANSKCYRPLGRLAHGNRPAIDKTYWRHQEVPIAEEDSIFAPRFCPDCREFIINDAHGNPYCPSCGLLFPDPNATPVKRPQRVPSDVKYHAERVPGTGGQVERKYSTPPREQSTTQDSVIGPIRTFRTTSRS
jgi:hypothetical protein